jgi:nitroreductase
LNTLEAIAKRRSIRKFKDTPIPDDALQTILTAASQAPSAKNRQPWRLVVVSGEGRAEMVRLMREGIVRMVARGEDTGSSDWTAGVMEQAPVTLFVFNPHGLHPSLAHSVEEMFLAVTNVQSKLLAALRLPRCARTRDSPPKMIRQALARTQLPETLRHQDLTD